MKTFRIILYLLVLHVVVFSVIFALGRMSARTVGHADEEIAESSALQTEITEIALSPTAAKNIGIDDSTIVRVQVTDYAKSLTFPAVVTDRPGHSVIIVPSPVSGVITKIHREAGVAVRPGDPLFDILLNQQEIIRGQTEYLARLNQKAINDGEIERLSALGENLVPQKKRELAFEKQKIDVDLNNAKKVLQLQGLTDQQITETLEARREIITCVTVYAPGETSDFRLQASGESFETNPEARSLKPEATLDLDQFHVTIGQNVEIGDALCRLSDLNQLTIQGKVFAADIGRITKALEEKSNVSAVFRSNGDAILAGGGSEIVNNLTLRSIDNRISEDNGTVACYVELANRRGEGRGARGEGREEREEGRGEREEGNQILTPHPSPLTPRPSPLAPLTWHFKPGQRCELNVNYEIIPGCIVLPVDAVAREIGEMVVFEWVGNEDDKRIWRKKSVHVLHRTKDVVVIANDGAVFPGTPVAAKGANFLLAALDAANQKTAGGGGVQHGDHVH